MVVVEANEILTGGMGTFISSPFPKIVKPKPFTVPIRPTVVSLVALVLLIEVYAENNVVVFAPSNQPIALTSQSPAVKLMLVIFVSVAVVSDT